MNASIVYWSVVVLFAVPFALMLGNVMFDSWRNFGKAVLISITFGMLPWFVAAAAGSDTQWERAKAFVFAGVCALLVLLIHLKFGVTIRKFLPFQ